MGLYYCGNCGHLNGRCGDESYACLCLVPDSAAIKRGHRRFLNSLHKEGPRRNYDPDDFDPSGAA
jgi:hypothetical protein